MKQNGNERERQILDMLASDGNTSVTRISEELDVSTVTIRNDLSALADKGLIVRTRGGALPAFHPQIVERQKQFTREKERIAKAAAEHIRDGDKVMITAGTTTGLIPKYLLGRRDVHIVTNSTLLIPYARINPSLHVTFVGGEFKPSAEAMVGPIALRELAQFHVQAAFIGTDGFSPRSGVTAHLVDVAEVVKKMTLQANETILVADSSKFGKAGFAHILPLPHVHTVITDDGLSTPSQRELEQLGLRIHMV
jgi:DeoR family galactitol utilization operon repressor